MGAFSTKKVHHVNTSVTRVVDDKDAKSSIPPSVITSIFKDDGQIVENVLEGLIQGIGSKANRMYSYGGNGYIHGRPSSQFLTADFGRATVEAHLRSLVGAAAIVDYYEFGPLNNLHHAWMKLVSDYAYASSTNEILALSVQKATPVYLKDITIMLSPASMNEVSMYGLSQWGTPPNAGYTPSRTIGELSYYVKHNPITLDPFTIEDYALVTYEWVDNAVVYTGTLIIPFETLDEDTDHFQIKYSLAGEAGYWTYKEGAGTYPTLDALFTTTAAPFGGYFPFGYMRYNNQSLDLTPTSAEYKSSKKLFKYLGIDYADLVASINENPDIADVEQAMLMMAIPANSTNEMDTRYLFDFFNQVDTPPSTTVIEYKEGLLAGKTVSQPNLKKIAWVVQDSKFKMIIECDAIFKRIKGGVVANKDKHSSGRRLDSYLVPSTFMNDQGMLQDTVITVTNPVHYFRYQITESTYEEIEVFNLKTIYYVWGGLTTVGDETDPTLLIPLDYGITGDYSLPDREILYARSLHFVFNSHTIQKIKWYQKGWFQIVVIIIAVIVMIFTYGATWQATLAAMAAMTAPALIMAVLTAIIKYVIFSALTRLFVKAVGAEAAFVIAIIAAAVGLYQGFDAGSIAGAPWASELLTLSTNLTSAVNASIQAGMSELMGQYTDFALFMQEQTKLLDTATELLDRSSILNPFVIFGETPNEFYNRTVHSGNIGLIGIAATTNYVEIALRLPELKDTMR